MTALTDEQLADLRARITRGPWKLTRLYAVRDGGDDELVGIEVVAQGLIVHSRDLGHDGPADAQFCANAEAMRLVPDLLAEVVRLRDELAEARREKNVMIYWAADQYGRAEAAEAAARTARETAIREAAEVVPNGWTGKPHMSNMDYGPNTAAAARTAILALLDSPPAGSKMVEDQI